MKPDYVNARIWKETRRLLRLIAAQSGEQMVQVLHRLCEAEWQRMNPPAADHTAPLRMPRDKED